MKFSTVSGRNLALYAVAAALLAAPACRKAPHGDGSKPAEAAASASPAADKPPEPPDLNKEATFTHVPEIYKAGQVAAVGKRARITLKFTRRTLEKDWIIMTAVDGSYQIAFLQYDERFKPVVDTMQPGVPYLVDFDVIKVTSGGAPKGRIVAINRQAPGPVPNEVLPLKEATERIDEIRALPPELRRERRAKMREAVEGQVEKFEPILQDLNEKNERQKASTPAPAK